MNDMNTYERIKSVKSKIEKLIENGHLKEAMAALDMYDEKMPGDPDICSMRAVIHIVEGDLDKAEKVLLEGLEKDSVHFDLLYNLAYICEQRGQLRAAMELYCKAGTVADASQLENVGEAIARLRLADSSLQPVEKDRIVFFCRPGLDNFLGDIVQGLSGDYFVRKIIVSDFSQIDEGMEWADVCWFDSCDGLLAYCSRKVPTLRKAIVCRIHDFESAARYGRNILWNNIDKVIFNGEYVRNAILEYLPELRTEKTTVMPDCINVNEYSFKNRKPGFNIAFAGNINDGIEAILLVHVFKSIYDHDRRYRLYINSELKNNFAKKYFEQMIRLFGMENNVIFDEKQENANQWLDDKDYILTSGLSRYGHIMVAQAMAKGIKPVIHNFPGAADLYPAKYLWNSTNEAADMIGSDCYNSGEYREYVSGHFHVDKIIKQIKNSLMDNIRTTEPGGITPLARTSRKPLISLVYRNYCGSNSVALYKSVPEGLLEEYRIELVRQDNSQRYFDMLNDSKMIITTHGSVKARISQKNLDLWHGFPLKAMGEMITGISKDEQNIREKVWSLADAVISYSQLYSSLFNACVGVGGEKFVITGAPRNDFLFKSDGRSILSEVSGEDICKKKIIFFLPTFRNTISGRIDGDKRRDNIFGMNGFDSAGFDDFLGENDILLFAKLHPHEEIIFIKAMEDMKTKNIRILSNDLLERNSVELYEILNAADILITDYSSVYFDFLLTDKPILFTPVDIESYAELRGFLLEPFDFWTPGPKATDQRSLENEIITCLSNNDYYGAERQVIKNLVHHYQDGESCRRTWELIKTMLRK